jgi:hypothetical protein
MNPQDVRLHDVDTSKGSWGIFVQSVAEAQNGVNVFLSLILEQSVDDEHVRSRRLEMLVSATELSSPSGRSRILNLIRTWIETTDGDGSLDVM